MVILKLQIKGIGAIKEADIILPASGIIEIGGRNEAGKSTVLHAIRYLLGGTARGEESPLRHGEKKAEIIAYIGEGNDGLQIVDGKSGYKYKLRRYFTESGTQVSVEAPDGAVYKSPQTLLNGFLSDLAFDPLTFMQLNEKDQADALLKVIDLPFDREEFSMLAGYGVNGDDPLTSIQSAYTKIYDLRKDVNRDLERAKAALESIEIPPEAEKIEAIPLSQLMHERRSLEELDKTNETEKQLLLHIQGKLNDNISNRKSKISAFERFKAEEQAKIARLKKEIDCIETRISDVQGQVRREIEELSNEHNTLSKQLENQTEYVNKLKEVDFVDIDNRISQVDEINRQAQESAQKIQARELKIKEKQAKEQELNELTNQSKDYTARLNAIFEYKQNLLKKTKFPIPGLSFDEDRRIIYDGESLKKRGQSIQLITSCAITAALKPHLRVILSPQETQLDSEHRAALENWAIENGFQILTCKVVERKEDGVRFFIEDGILMDAVNVL